MYSLIIFDLLQKNNNNEKITDSQELTIFSPFKSKSLFKLGYHYFIDRTRDAFETTIKNLDTKKEFYYVINKFEVNILDYSDDISNLTKIYFNNKNLTFGNDFYKLWEILFIFNIINKNIKDIIILSNNSTDSSNSIIYFSEKILNIKSSNYKIHNINIVPEKEFEFNKDIKNQFISPKIKCDLIIASCENYYSSINSKEQESYKLILGELLIILSSLNKNGNCIFKIFDTFTFITIKVIYILSTLFDKIYVYKPLLSRLSDSEKFLICKNYKYDNTEKIIKIIKEILSKIDSNQFLNDIFVDYTLPNDFINNFKFINIKLVNEQQILINEIIKYIKDNNYFGDNFHNCKNKQIEATKWWINIFFPPSNNIYENNKELISKMLSNTIDQNNFDQNKFLSNFV